MRPNFGILAILSILLVLSGCQKASADFQKDADIIRLQHIQYYGGLIEAYKAKTGYYPFQGETDLPTYVHVANDKQIEFTRGGPPFSHRFISFKQFISELESALGSPIEEHYDPQFHPVDKPNFYIYLVRDDTYFFAVHVHQPFPFARKVAENYFKVEITNNPTSRNRAKSPEKLFSSAAFKAEISKTITKPGFFKERAVQYVHYTKTLDP
jgi:hypothetical protein